MAYIVKPLITEKMNAISEKSNRFGFIVRPEANKLQIKAEVEAFVANKLSASVLLYTSEVFAFKLTVSLNVLNSPFDLKLSNINRRKNSYRIKRKHTL